MVWGRGADPSWVLLTHLHNEFRSWPPSASLRCWGRCHPDWPQSLSWPRFTCGFPELSPSFLWWCFRKHEDRCPFLSLYNDGCGSDRGEQFPSLTTYSCARRSASHHCGERAGLSFPHIMGLYSVTSPRSRRSGWVSSRRQSHLR